MAEELAGSADVGWLSRSIGAAVRARRLERGWSMREAAARCGVSQPFWSLLERGRTTASIATLYRLAGALDLPVAALLPPERHATVTVVRAGEGRRLAVSDDRSAAIGRLASSADGELTLTEYCVTDDQTLGAWFQTSGTVAVYVISGELDVEVSGEGHWQLTAGDLLFQPGAVPRRWARYGTEPLRLLVVNERGSGPPVDRADK